MKNLKVTTTKTPAAYTKEMHDANQAAAMSGTMRDELNPAFILSGVCLELVCKIAKGEINIQDLALLELEGRGYDKNGFWIGFKKIN